MKKKLLMIMCAMIICSTLYAQNGFEAKIRRAGLINVVDVDSTLRVKLMYATEDNFMRENLYGDLTNAYLLPHFARKLVRANCLLRQRRPGWRILVCDAARPISIQRYMYSLVEGTPNQVYVANGDLGGRHNFGVAVDVTLLDETGAEVDMGTPVDFFGEEAHTGNESVLAAQGRISSEAVDNRLLLVDVMHEAGLVPYRREWWHYEEPMPMSEVRTQFKLLDF